MIVEGTPCLCRAERVENWGTRRIINLINHTKNYVLSESPRHQTSDKLPGFQLQPRAADFHKNQGGNEMENGER